MRLDVITKFHTEFFGGHEGALKLTQRLQLYYYWPNMKEEIQRVVDACETCQKRKTQPSIPSAELQLLPVLTQPNQRVHADLFGPLKTSATGKKFLLVMTDAFTKYVELVAIPNKEAETVAEAIFNNWICKYGIPVQGKEFMATVCQDLWNKLNIVHITTSARHPQANAQAEVANKTIARYLASYVDETTLDWEQFIPPMMFSYNTSFHRSIKTSPFFLTFGVHPNLPNQLRMPQYGFDPIMRLFKLHPFPLPFANDTFLIPDVRNDVLAVSNTNVRFSSQMSSLELQSCSRINKIYLCERNGVMNKFPEDTCLGALYHQKFDLAKSICQFHVEPAREFIYQLLNNWFHIYVMAPVTVPITCQDKNHFEWHLKAGITRQHLPAGCTADIPRNLLLSDLSILVPQDYVQFDMEWDPVSFLPDFQSMVLPEFRKISDRVGPSAVSLATLQSIVASRLSVPRFFHPLHFTFNAITIILVGLLVFVGGHYFYQRFRERQTKLQQAHVQRAVQSVLAKHTLNRYDDEIRLQKR